MPLAVRLVLFLPIGYIFHCGWNWFMVRGKMVQFVYMNPNLAVL